MRIGIYPGSFDPVTRGHLDIIDRAARLVDELVIGVLVNSSKKPLFSMEERVDFIRRVTKNIPNITVEAYDGLLVEFAKSQNASVLVRGLRAVTDFEYELQIAQTNHVEYPEVETIFLTTNLKYSYLSSSVVREFAAYGGDITKFVPKQFVDRVYRKYNIKS